MLSGQWLVILCGGLGVPRLLSRAGLGLGPSQRDEQARYAGCSPPGGGQDEMQM